MDAPRTLAGALGVPVRGSLPADPAAAAVLSDGTEPRQTPREFSMSSPLLNAALNDAGARLSAVMSVTPHVHVSVRAGIVTAVAA